jgi:threonine aldolase
MAFVNLYSDTQTRPTGGHARGHRRRPRWATSSVGADPTTRALEERVAALLGHEAAVFLPSGTMCNEIAIRLHIRPGGERMFIGRETHTLIAEAGGPAQLSGAVITEVDGESGMFTADALGQAIHGSGPAGATGRASAWFPSSRRRTWAAGACGRSSRCAPSRGRPRAGLATHPRRRAADERRRGQQGRRRRLGGRLRQRLAGLHEGPRRPGRRLPGRLGRLRRGGVALEADARRRHAPVGRRGRRGLYALDHHVERLADDHAARQAPGRGASRRCPASSSTPATVETNIVIFAVPDAAAFCAASRRGRRHEPFRAHRVRAVTHPRRRRARASTGRWSRGAGPRGSLRDGDRLRHVPTVRGDLRASITVDDGAVTGIRG